MPDRYAVIGNPVAHSKSPLIHAAFASATDQAMSYERLLAPLDGFAAAAQRFASEGGMGLNVTAPFKLDAFALATEKSARARSAGACNTLAWRGSHWFGDNTDGAGLIHDLMHNLGVAISGRNVLIFGAGGAARGILGPLLAETPRRVALVNRTQSKADGLAAHFAAQGNIAAIPSGALGSGRFDIVINATSIGLQDTDSAGVWAAGVFAPGALAYDLIYADAPTPFARWASANGAARTADGLGMLIEQAAESFLVWRGVRPESAPLFPLLRPV
jgi:shikimate dehydrogenase